MKRYLLLLPLIMLFLSVQSEAQPCRMSGKITDAETGEALSYAHVWVKALQTGTTSDARGRYTLPLPCGEYRVRVSYLGYRNTERTITISDSTTANFALHTSTISFPEIVVVPGENPAIPIIRKAIAAKKIIDERLKEYQVDAHTKLRVYDGKIKMEGIDESNLSQDGVFFVAETHSTAYWTKDDGVKEIIHARKQAIPRGEVYNLLNSMPARVNFSRDVLEFGDKDVTGPISEEGLDDYWYELVGTTEYDGQTVYKINVHPASKLSPLLDGTIYIADSSFALMMVDVGFTESVFGSNLRNMHFRQNFTYVDGLWLPADAIIHGEIQVAAMAIISLKLDILAIMKDYQVNGGDVASKLDGYIIEVAPTADDADSAAWAETSFIPSMPDEMQLYSSSDSTKEVVAKKERSYGFSDFLFGKTMVYDDASFYTPGIIDLYRFNKIEGHAIRLKSTTMHPTSWLYSANGAVGYGFSDEKWKWSLETVFPLYQKNDLNFRIHAYNDLRWIDPAGYVMDDFLGLVAQAALMYDPRDFYYSSGWESSIGGYLFDHLHWNAEGGYDDYSSAIVNTDEHLFRDSRAWAENPAINDGFISRVGLDLFFDSRPVILNKGKVERFGQVDVLPEVGIEMNRANIGGETWDFLVLNARLTGQLGVGGWGNVLYQFAGYWANEKLPTQRTFYLTGSEYGITSPWIFRTALPREFGGDQMATGMVQWSTGNLLFRALGLPNIPYVNNYFWDILFFGNGGWTDMRTETAALQTYQTSVTPTPFYEAGLSIDRIFSLFRIDFGWRMNHYLEGHNFFWGISLSTDRIFGVTIEG